MKKFAQKLDKFFGISASGSSISTEIIAGLTTFFAMCYIVVVNPSSMTSGVSQSLYNACFLGGIVATVVTTLIMALWAKKPFALSAGMGLNSFFFVSFLLPIMLGLGGETTYEEGYAAGLAVILLSGVIFLVLSLTGVRKWLAVSLPKTLKIAIPAGIGGFIAFIGFQNAGLITANQYTLVQFCDFTQPFYTWAPAVIAFVGFILIVAFSSSSVNFLKKGAVILGIAAATAIYYILAIFIPELRPSAELQNLGTVFSDWFHNGFSFYKGFGVAFGGYLGSIFSVIMIVITYCLVDMFDTLGTVYGTASSVGLVDENGDPLSLGEIMTTDSIGTCLGAMMGTSTITTFVESSAGVSAGGRTGLASVVTALMFALCIFLGPVVNYIPSCATASALIYVGVLMFRGAKNVNWDDPRAAATAFITIVMMLCTYSITNGIMIGAMTYSLFTLLTRKFEKKDIVVTVIAVLGLLRFIFVAM